MPLRCAGKRCRCRGLRLHSTLRVYGIMI
jgi:hypothetical protein